MKIIIAIIVSSFLASGASAHSKVDTTTPPNQAELAEVPVQIDLDFAKKDRLTNVKVTHESGPMVPTDWADTSGVCAVATAGEYRDASPLR